MTISSIDNTLEQSLVMAMERIMTNLSAQFQLSQDTILSRIDALDTRLSEIEERISSQHLVINNFDDRIADIESKFDTFDPSNINLRNEPEWEPSGAPETDILLLGDSNSGGK